MCFLRGHLVLEKRKGNHRRLAMMHQFSLVHLLGLSGLNGVKVTSDYTMMPNWMQLFAIYI